MFDLEISSVISGSVQATALRSADAHPETSLYNIDDSLVLGDCLNQKFIRRISIRTLSSVLQVDEWMFDVGWASLLLLFILQVCNEIMAILARALLG